MKSDQLCDQIQEPIVTSQSKEVLPPYLAYVGINEAARLVGKGKQQIYRDIESGKLSWHIDNNGKKLLQIADLDRVYKLKSKNVTGNNSDDKNHLLPLNEGVVTDGVTTNRTIDTAVELAVMKAELRAKDEALKRMEEEVKDLRQNRDKQLDTIQRLMMLLPAPEPEPVSTKKSWWQRLIS